MAGRRGFRRLTVVCASIAGLLVMGAAASWFVLLAELAINAGIGAVVFAVAAWVAHGFALPDE